MSEDAKVVSLDGKPIEHPDKTAERHFNMVDLARKHMDEHKIVASAFVQVDDEGLIYSSFCADWGKQAALIGALEYVKWRTIKEDLDKQMFNPSRKDDDD